MLGLFRGFQNGRDEATYNPNSENLSGAVGMGRRRVVPGKTAVSPRQDSSMLDRRQPLSDVSSWLNTLNGPVASMGAASLGRKELEKSGEQLPLPGVFRAPSVRNVRVFYVTVF